jgi:hypothetical protein
MLSLRSAQAVHAQGEDLMTQESWETWTLRLVSNGETIQEIECDGHAPSIGARVYQETDADDPGMVRHTEATVTAQDARVDRFNCYLLVIAKVTHSHVFQRRD